MSGKKYQEAKSKVELRNYGLDEAVQLMREIQRTRFDETAEIAIRLGVNPRHADQMVRGTVILPHGLGRTVRVCVIASGEKVLEAEQAGADHAGGNELVEKIQGGWLDFDAVVSTPDMMKSVGKLGRILGPRGLMPNPKAGSVTFDVAKAVQEIKAGKLEFRVDKNGVVHAPFGKLSFESDRLVQNASSIIDAVVRAKPASAKGRYLKGVAVASTMGPGIKIDVGLLEGGG